MNLMPTNGRRQPLRWRRPVHPSDPSQMLDLAEHRDDSVDSETWMSAGRRRQVAACTPNCCAQIGSSSGRRSSTRDCWNPPEGAKCAACLEPPIGTASVTVHNATGATRRTGVSTILLVSRPLGTEKATVADCWREAAASSHSVNPIVSCGPARRHSLQATHTRQTRTESARKWRRCVGRGDDHSIVTRRQVNDRPELASLSPTDTGAGRSASRPRTPVAAPQTRQAASSGHKWAQMGTNADDERHHRLAARLG
jgi:hypothetical protein